MSSSTACSCTSLQHRRAHRHCTLTLRPTANATASSRPPSACANQRSTASHEQPAQQSCTRRALAAWRPRKSRTSRARQTQHHPTSSSRCRAPSPSWPCPLAWCSSLCSSGCAHWQPTPHLERTASARRKSPPAARAAKPKRSRRSFSISRKPSGCATPRMPGLRWKLPFATDVQFAEPQPMDVAAQVVGGTPATTSLDVAK
mmetsp:Transcript_57748/g.150476  ORF Transcript_57748/g.150476 Transcript_57748/m.150476 type:complete len:202 (+) Transcript_57748:227-832(+)